MNLPDMIDLDGNNCLFLLKKGICNSTCLDCNQVCFDFVGRLPPIK